MVPDIAQTFIQIVYAPIFYPDVLWLFIPVVLSIFLMELYFHRYPREGVGYHRSLENTIFLVFIGFNLANYVVTHNAPAIKYYVVALLTGLWIWIAVLDFLHRLPTRFVWGTSSKFLVAYSAYVGIVLTYSPLLNREGILHYINIAVSILVLLGLIIMTKRLMDHFEPKGYEEIELFLKKIEEDIEKATDGQPK